MKSLKETYKKIKNLEIQGATAVAKTILLSLKEYGLNLKTKNISDWTNKIKQAGEYLLSTRPTEPMAINGVKFTLKTISNNKPKTILQAKDCLEKGVNDFLILMEDAGLKIILYGQKIIKNNNKIFTHCHSWLVEQILIKAHKNGKKFQVFNTETRPLFQGHITAKKLLKANIPVTMVADSAAGFFISKHSGDKFNIDKVLIGADAILKQGDVINKIGSFTISSVAYFEKIPVYIAAPLLKFHSKSWIKIEKRDPKEIWENAPKKIKIINLAFDKIPSKYLKGIICEAGIIKPEQAYFYAKKFYPWI
ncbi:S-methyl-5-thioribose-1-phosphate isomerase [bacterium]|nr:S-methyl-5-thioribose-1-phosphate isomerase [bacterium]